MFYRRRIEALEQDVEGLGHAFDTYRHDLGELTSQAREAARAEVDVRIEELIGEAEGRLATAAKTAIDERSRAAQAALVAKQGEVVSNAQVVVASTRTEIAAVRTEIAAVRAEVEAIRAALRASLSIELPVGG